MRRLLAISLTLAALASLWVMSSGASGDSGTKYWVELDNAFGLVKGGDVKVAGVRAGTITDLKLDTATNRALVQLDITKSGFGSIRTDVTCASRPQSLIGEYYVDCQPGTSPTELKPGSTIPVTHTSSTVGPDLVNNVLRRPYRERLSLIISELGAAVAGNEDNLNAAIRRGSPALRETDKVLAILAKQNKVLADLTTNADTVIGDLANNREDVGRFIDKANATAVASAERKADIALGFHRLPGFLAQLTPTMKALGQTADAQAPTLRNLRAVAPDLYSFFKLVGPFADASRPAFKALGKASVTGDKAVKAAKPVVTQLHRFTRGTPELAKNLSIVLQHLDDPQYAVENDPRAAQQTGRAAPTGYTGLEALLQYVYDQGMSTNVYDQNNHILKVGLITPNDPCSAYADAAAAKKLQSECASWLGPNQPGVNYTDPTAGLTPATARKQADTKKSFGGDRPDLPITPPAATTTPQVTAPATTAPTVKVPTIKIPQVVPGVDVPPITLPGFLGGGSGGSGGNGDGSGNGGIHVGGVTVGGTKDNRATRDRAGRSLLDFLLGS